MPSEKNKLRAWLFEQKDGRWSLSRIRANRKLIENIKSIESAKYIARLIGYKIVKIFNYEDWIKKE
jgi:uncharacterized protein YbcI